MALSKKQDSLYWREWAAAKKFCLALDLPEPDRHALHAQALGADKSHKDFTNADLDKVLATFRAISDPANVQAQLRQIDQPRTRLLYAIDRLGSQLAGLAAPVCSPPGAYAQAICKDRFGTTDLDSLTDAQLTQLRNTLADRLVINHDRRKKKAKTPGTRAPSTRAPILSNHPF